jgi:UDP:flavonoid glycosyltransferase YjiC (YdhE family)
MNVLLFCEAVTLAHSARVAVIARGLATRGHRVTVAGAEPIARFDHPLVSWRQLGCIGARRFVRSLARGTPAYGEADLRRYVDDERRCIDAVAPDFVAADFRPTVAVSARLARVPCAAIVNAYWSPASAGQLPMPVLPFTGVLPLPLAQWLFDRGSRWILPAHCRPWNRVRAAHGLDDLGADLRRIYCDADTVLYPDIPGMFALGEVPPHHHFIGPLLWSPAATLPPWWSTLPTDRQVAYLSLGSSGDPRVLEAAAQGLLDGGLSVMVTARGNEADLLGRWPHVFVAEYLPGDKATARADIVICNGGSMTCHQAFTFGKPVLGITSNMDQFMNMQGTVASGAGLSIRADRLTANLMRQAAIALICNSKYEVAGRRLAERAAVSDPIVQFEMAASELSH